MLSGEEFRRHLRTALNDLYEPDQLRNNPLAALFGVANRPDTFSALQGLLTEAIEALEPQQDEPDKPSATGEFYELLLFRYVHRWGQQRVARQLSMSERHLRRREHQAIDVLADRLWRRFGLDENRPDDRRNSTVDTRPVDDELAWLRNTPPDRPVDLDMLLPHVVALTEPLAAQRGARLVVTLADALPQVAVHEVALSQALVNLLSVAIHRAPGGAITLSAQPVPPGVLLEITVAFCARSDAQPPCKDDPRCLEMAQQLAELCSGRLVLSEQHGRFSAELVVPALGQIAVLVIDDNADTLQLLQRYAAGSRYRLVVTRDPEQALTLAQEASPSVIVLDVMMPRVDGWRLLAQLHNHPATAHLPILICTILPQEEMALALGASGFTQKPVTRQQFLTALDRLTAPMAAARR